MILSMSWRLIYSKMELLNALLFLRAKYTKEYGNQ
jgi:hypothetical protein